MKPRWILLVLPLLALPFAVAADKAEPAKAAPSFPKFEMREIDKGLDIGYAVLLVDVDGDKKTDIVVVDTKRVIWYQNPDWKLHTIIQGKTKPDNVCLAAADIDGDGKIDFALGAEWKPFNTKKGGTLQWLKRGKSLDDEWTLYPIADDVPTIHRIRFADLDGNGKPVLIAGPLMGRNATKAKNWMDGEPVQLAAYRIPKDPTKDRWIPEVIDQSLHVIHNFYPLPAKSGKGADILTASYEGVNRLSRVGDKWKKQHIGAGNQANLASNRGSSEVKQGKLKDGTPFIATIEPWHGNEVVVYLPPSDPSKTLWDRHVIDNQLAWGHAVWCADLDGDGGDELVIGVRDNLNEKVAGEKCGVRIYKQLDARGTKWERHLIDEGGVAVEDLAVADLDGDGRPDIVAVGRKTKNVRVYRNMGVK